MRFWRRLRILPLLITVSVLSFTIRLGEVVTGLHHQGSAFAQQEVNVPEPPFPGDENAAAHGEDHGDGHGAETISIPPTSLPAPVANNTPGEKIEWKDSSEAEFAYSEVREELYKDLAKRREELDRREKGIGVKEALLEAAERELDQKLRELTAIKNELEALLKQQSDEEKARIDSLVRIYEGMKAKDAARIFDTLDMDVLITVMTRMSERKSAPILAEMNPDRARSVTILMAQQTRPIMPSP